MERRRSIARALVMCICGIALVFGSLSDVIRGASAAPHAKDIISSSLTVLQTDHSGQHPCKRGAAVAPVGACAVSGFSAGLPTAGFVHAPPAVAGGRLDLGRYASLAHQWRGFPPDRPPRP
jgi:hypothetical protein